MSLRVFAATFVLFFALFSSAARNSVFAQEHSTGEDVQAAANAFEAGQRAQLAGDPARAADLFELAYRFSPNPVALRSAIRNHLSAQNTARAATLALEAMSRYADDSGTREVSERALGSTQGLARVSLRCTTPCAIAVDGRAVMTREIGSYEMFIEPGSHQLRAAWGDSVHAVESIEVAAGDRISHTFERPEAPTEPAVSDSAPVPALASTSERAADEREGWSPWIFYSGVAITAVVTGAAIWSGADTLSARDDYEEMPTKDGYEEGTSLETRTNVLIGSAIVLGLGTAAVGIFLTDFEREKDEDRAAVEVVPALGGISVRGNL